MIRVRGLCRNITLLYFSGLFIFQVLSPVCGRSTHTRLIDSTINDGLRVVTGYLRPTPADFFEIISGIQIAELCRWYATLSLDQP